LLTAGALRKAREVCTERDLLQAHGSFYELPALNAGGAIRLAPSPRATSPCTTSVPTAGCWSSPASTWPRARPTVT
jgi:hypothetical protein